MAESPPAPRARPRRARPRRARLTSAVRVKPEPAARTRVRHLLPRRNLGHRGDPVDHGGGRPHARVGAVIAQDVLAVVPATGGRHVAAVQVGRARAVVVHPVVVGQERGRLAAGPVRAPAKPVGADGVGIRRRTRLGQRVELRREAVQAGQTPAHPLDVGQHKQLLGGREVVVVSGDVERPEPFCRPGLVYGVQHDGLAFLVGAMTAGHRHRLRAGHVGGRVGQRLPALLSLGRGGH